MNDMAQAKDLARTLLVAMNCNFTYSIDTHDYIGIMICNEGMTTKIPLWLAADICRIAHLPIGLRAAG